MLIRDEDKGEIRISRLRKASEQERDDDAAH
jgi:hypothetical protein